MRGSGESDGHMADEYLQQEQDDALEVIAWIAAQPWCTGAVGMQGKSWSGFNALQVAARRPTALKAIITTFSTDHRYTDDIHYMGGCLLNDNLWWGSIMLAYQSRPLDPKIIGSSWRERWLERIETLPFFPALWLRHQRYDEYWKHGSVCEDFAAIDCPVLAIGGWSDSLHQCRSAAARRFEGSASRHHRPLGPYLSARRRAGTCHRLPSRGRALVGSLAQRPRHRNHERTDAARLCARPGGARRHPHLHAGPLGRRSPLPVPQYPAAAAIPTP